MKREVEDVVLDFTAPVKVALMDDNFVCQPPALGDGLACWRDNTTAADAGESG